MKAQVDIRLVNQFKDYLAWVNSIPLEDMELVDRGEPVRVMEGSVEEFKFIGLSNTDFIRSEWYRPCTRLCPEDVCPIDDMRDPCSQKCLECEFCVGHTIVDAEDKEVKCTHDKYKKLEERS